jgi:hypothetical protein
MVCSLTKIALLNYASVNLRCGKILSAVMINVNEEFSEALCLSVVEAKCLWAVRQPARYY